MNAWMDVPLELAVSKGGISYLKEAGRENGDIDLKSWHSGHLVLS